MNIKQNNFYKLNDHYSLLTINGQVLTSIDEIFMQKSICTIPLPHLPFG